MLTTFRAAGLVWPTLLAASALAVLLGLGSWQIQRKALKDGLIAQIKARTSAPPVALDTALAQMTATDGTTRGHGWAQMEYARVRALGRFEHSRELYLYAPDQRLGPGYLVFTPLVLADAPCHRFVVVNRGFVPEALREPKTRMEGQLEGPRAVVGLLRLAETPGTFTPVNEIAKNMWFWRDLRAMSQAIDPSPKACPVPIYLEAEIEPANPGGWPRGGATNLAIPNRHLEYALTWYGLAATLMGVWIAFVAGRLRRP